MISFQKPSYATAVSTLALLISLGSFYTARQSFDLSFAKEQREIRDKMPAIDLQLRADGASSADVTVSIINRSDANIAPQDIIVFPSVEAGEFYFSSARQSLDKLSSSLSLLPMGAIAPKAAGTMKARLSGVSDGKDDAFKREVELQFAVRVRFGDEQDTLRTFEVVRRVKH
jgi:hypothetical protein